MSSRKVTLGEIVTSFDYGLNAASKEFDGVNKYIRITDIDETTNLFNPNPLVSPDCNLDERYLVKENDILFARTGASVGKVYKYNPVDGRLFWAGFLINAHIKPTTSSDYIFYALQTKKYKDWVSLMSARSGQPGINAKEFASYEFTLPNSDTQKHISAFLNLYYRKCKLQKQKVELLQQLFKHTSNFFANEFEIVDVLPIKKITIEFNQRTTVSNQYELLSSTLNGLTLQSNHFDKQVASENTIGYKILPRNYLTYRSMSDTGVFRFNLQNITDFGIVSPAYPVFSAKEEYILKEFLIYYLNHSFNFKQQLLQTKEGGTRFALSFSKLSQITVNLPSTAFQHHAVTILNLIKTKLSLESRKLALMEKYKKGLLQKLFV